eukprot:Gregarina_sp_Poly_1__6276@NODE_332_length_9468_cov_135_874162_g280_i0_p2_GENE_NODE_332_length_9468_cov_135_874162_g280_i0NODE_332_length_9468_cov_135_874162_g280_i0_p2_ORF_typecomplete_len685_score50_52Methyltransf_30/PF05430_11/0_037_NODE_332_length_9468_cov_135_874162_g280_i011993253
MEEEANGEMEEYLIRKEMADSLLLSKGSDMPRHSHSRLLHPLETEYMVTLVYQLYKQSRVFAITFLRYEERGRSAFQMLPQAFRAHFWSSWTGFHVVVFYVVFLLGWLWLRDVSFNSFQDIYNIVFNVKRNFILHIGFLMCTLYLFNRGCGPRGGAWGSSIRRTLRIGVLILLAAIALNASLDAFLATWTTLQKTAASWTHEIDRTIANARNGTTVLALQSMKRRVTNALNATAFNVGNNIQYEGWNIWTNPFSRSPSVLLSTASPLSHHQDYTWEKSYALSHPTFMAFLRSFKWLKRRTDFLELAFGTVYAYLIVQMLVFDLMGILLSPFTNQPRRARRDNHFALFRFPQFAKVILRYRSEQPKMYPNQEEFRLSVVPLSSRLQYSVLLWMVSILCKQSSPSVFYYMGIKLHRAAENLERRIKLIFYKNKKQKTAKIEYVLRHGEAVRGTAIVGSNGQIIVTEVRSKVGTDSFEICDRDDVLVWGWNKGSCSRAATRICCFGHGKYAGECKSIDSCPASFDEDLLLVFGDSKWNTYQTIIFAQCLKEAGYTHTIMVVVSNSILESDAFQHAASVLCVGDGYVQASKTISDPIVMVRNLFLYEPIVNLRLMRNRDIVKSFIGNIQYRHFYSEDHANREELMDVLGPTCHFTDWIREDGSRSEGAISLSPLLFSSEIMALILAYL